MPETKSAPQLLSELKDRAASMGLALNSTAASTLAGEVESIRSKWWFGGRKALYRMSIRLDETNHSASFREAVAESSWGLPPPTITVETERVSGWERSGTKKEKSVGGGGEIDFARFRHAVEDIVTQAGWQFRLEGGKMP